MGARIHKPSDTAALAPLLFGLDDGRTLLDRVAAKLGVAPGRHEERRFEDGEHKIRPLDEVRGRSVYLVQSIFGDTYTLETAQDKLVKLLFFIGALRDAGASQVTLYAPYLCYMRKDSRSQYQDPLSSRYLAQLFEALGLDCLAVADVHNVSAFENAFRCRTLHLDVQSLFLRYLTPMLAEAAVTVASPDLGGAKRAERLRQRLAESLGRPVASALVEKYRSQGVVRGGRIVGDVSGRTVILVDDLIATGTTMRRAAEAFAAAGAKQVYALATHAVFTAQTQAELSTPAITQIVTTDSVRDKTLTGWSERHRILDLAPLIADSIGGEYHARSYV